MISHRLSNPLRRLYTSRRLFSAFGADTITQNTTDLMNGVLNGKRSSLSRAITLIESARMDHRRQAELLLDGVLSKRRKETTEPAEKTIGDTMRIGIAGPPGAGKSSFIEVFGSYLTAQGYKVAVIAVDPSSKRTGGSILGDKTRMQKLSTDPNAYVRPSPTRGALGGVAEHTHDVVLLCEGAGYDIVLVETVGLGQSEIAVDSTVDMLALLVPPGGGDELQGVKRGIMEVADMVIVNKADGALLSTARRTATDYRRAFQLARRKHDCWSPVVQKCSAHEQIGLDSIWKTMEKFRDTMLDHGALQERRRAQGSEWMWSQMEAQLSFLAHRNESVRGKAEEMKSSLAAGLMTPRRAATVLVETLLGADHPALTSATSAKSE